MLLPANIQILIRYLSTIMLAVLLLSFHVSADRDENSKVVINPEFMNFNISHGLASNVAYAILEDRQGFIWIGTQDGLNRFDGYNYVVYRIGAEGSQFISHSGINVLMEDKEGFIWIGTEGGGLNCYDPETEKFWYFFHDPEDPESLSSNTITSIAEDKDQTIWIGTPDGLNRMQKVYATFPSSEYTKPFECKFIRYYAQQEEPNSISSDRIFCMYVDSQNNLWIGTSSGLNLFLPEARNMQDGIIIKYTAGTIAPVSLSHNNINSIFEDSHNSLWIGTSNGFSILSDRGISGIPETSRIIHISPQHGSEVRHNVVHDIIEDPDGNIWIATMGGGLNVVSSKHLSNSGDITFQNFAHDELDPNSISSNAINSLLISRDGHIWYTTNNRGIGYVNRGGGKFHTLRHNPKNPNSLSNNVVKSVIEDRSGDLWIGTWGGGLVKYTPETEKYRTFTQNQEKTGWLGSDIIQAIVEDNSGLIWIGTQGLGLYSLNPETEVFNHILSQTQSRRSNLSLDIWSLFPGRNGEHIWIGTYEGLVKYDTRSRTFIRFIHDPEDDQSISFNEIRSLYEDAEENLWIGTGGGGLNRLDIHENKFYHYNYKSNDSTSVSNNSIYSIFEDRTGNLWIGTLGGGLNKIEAAQKYIDQPVFHHYSKADGLANDVVKGILEDKSGNLWISTTNGLSKLDTEAKIFVNYSESDGLQSNVFNLGACFKTKDGQMFFGGVNGLTSFDPNDIQENMKPPKVLITDFRISNQSIAVGEKVGNKIILERSILLTDEIDLSHLSRVISFEFSTLSFFSQEKIKFYYRLRGLSDNWTETDFRGRFITYSNLKPGEYQFEVKASNTDGIFMDNATSLSIIIHPAFYRTQAALIVYLFLIIGFLAYARRISRNRMRLKFEMEQERSEFQRRKEVDQMKLQFFTNISHEFRTPLTLLYGPLQKLKEEISDNERNKQYGIMEKNMKRMLNLVNQIIDFRKMDQGALEFKAIEGNVVDTIKDVCSLFEEMASHKNIKYDQILYDREIRTWYDPDKIEKILTNILSNAFKYTAAEGRILVEADRCHASDSMDLIEVLESEKHTAVADEYFYISVTDTGKGIRKEDLALIFTRFYRVEDSSRTEYWGTGMGIGLSMAKKLAEMHHGETHVRSEINKGSTFTVFIPLGKEYLSKNELSTKGKITKDKRNLAFQETILIEDKPETRAHQQNIITEVPTPGDNKKLPLLLLVEDDLDLLGYLHDSLAERYRIHTAENGVQALKSVIINHPKLVISDIMMPEMDGLDLTNKIKTDIRISHIPVILLTARSTIEQRLEGLDAGADAYLSKPFHLKNLISQIENLLNSRKLLKEQFLKNDQIRPEEINLKSIDQKYLDKAIATVEKFIDDPTFTVEQYAKEMFDSRVQLYRKLKGLTGLSPNEFVRNIRIKRAAEILIKEGITVGEVMYRVGFSNRSYFNRCFRQVYDTSPLDYQQNQKV